LIYISENFAALKNTKLKKTDQKNEKSFDKFFLKLRLKLDKIWKNKKSSIEIFDDENFRTL
jgi:hypothetical protein